MIVNTAAAILTRAGPKRRIRKAKNSQEAHEAIRPTSVARLPSQLPAAVDPGGVFPPCEPEDTGPGEGQLPAGADSQGVPACGCDGVRAVAAPIDATNKQATRMRPAAETAKLSSC